MEVDVERLGEWLAHIERLERGQLLSVGLDQVGQGEENPLPGRRLGVAPLLLEGAPGVADGQIDIAGFAGGNLCDHLARAGIADFDRLPRPGFPTLTADHDALMRAVEERREGRGHLDDHDALLVFTIPSWSVSLSRLTWVCKGES